MAAHLFMDAPDTDRIAARLNQVLAETGGPPLDTPTALRFAAYYALLLRWNAHTNLTAIRDEDGILRRHFAESIFCARALSAGIATLLDLGSGAGFPGLPIALCRPEIAVTLAESQNKKAAFLQEAVRTLGVPVRVHAARAESLARQFDCVTLRAVDRMAEAVAAALDKLQPGGILALLTARGAAPSTQAAAGSVTWEPPIAIPGSEERIVLLGRTQP